MSVGFVNVSDSTANFVQGYVITAALGSTVSGSCVHWFVSTFSALWTGRTSTDWHVATNWGNSVIPTVGDTVDIPVTTNQPKLSVIETITDLRIETGAIVDTDSKVLTLKGDLMLLGQQKDTGSAGKILLSGGSAIHTITTTGGALTSLELNDVLGAKLANAGLNFLANGILTVNVGILDLQSLDSTIQGLAGASGNGSIVLGSETLTVNGSGSFSGVITDGLAASPGKLTVSGASTILTLTGTAANTYTGLTSVVSGATLNLGKTAVLAVAGDLGIGNTLTSGIVTLLSGSQLSTNSNVTLDNTAVWNLGGFSQSVATLNNTTTTTSSVNLGAAGALTVKNGSYYGLFGVSAGATFTVDTGTVVLGVTGVFALPFNVAVINNGTLNNHGGAQFSVTGTFTLNDGCTLQLEGATPFPMVTGLRTLTTASTVLYDDTSPQSVAAVAYGNLTLDGAATKTFAGGTGLWSSTGI